MLNKEKQKLAKGQLPNLEDIKEDMTSLSANVISLAQTIKTLGSEKAHAAAEFVRDRADDVKAYGDDALERLEDGIKENPRKSIAGAFAAGLLTSYLLGRRK